MSKFFTPYQKHDHANCVKTALAGAQALCKKRGVRLTVVREKVLALVWQSHKPIGAYEIMAELTQGASNPAQPPTVYRALDFLQTHGLVHRLASINAYIGCNHPGKQHRSCFFICTQCRTAIEIEDHHVSQSLNACANEHGFIISDTSIELSGLCINCNA